MPANVVKIKINTKGGPVILIITSGHSTIGSYLPLYAIKGEYVFREFGNPPRYIDDAIPDIAAVPPLGNELLKCRVYLEGHYQPAPGHQQISVDYKFVQDAKEVHVTEIRRKSNKAFEIFQNTYEFIERS